MPMPTARDYEDILAERLAELAMPENQGEGLHQQDFIRLFLLTIIVPLVALFLGWFL